MRSPNDFGPVYAETDMTRFPVEPFNTYSNLIFLAIIIWAAWRTKCDARRYGLVVWSLPVLFVGFVGGTVFHATRSHSAWLIMDFVPIAVLAFAAAIHLWSRVVGSRLRAVFLTIAMLVVPRLVATFSSIPRQLRIGIGYSAMALALLAPAFLISKKHHWRGVFFLISATVYFATAIGCRSLDHLAEAYGLTMGSHFLWHIFGGISVFYLLRFIIADYEEVAPRT